MPESRQLRLFLLPSVAASVILACGCSNASKPYTPARGQVLLGDQPAEGVLVTLVPTTGDITNPDLKPCGRVGADGWYTITTYEAATRQVHEGAPPGEYLALITWAPDVTKESLKKISPEPDRLGNRYQDPRTAPRVEVKSTATELPAIQIHKPEQKSRNF